MFTSFTNQPQPLLKENIKLVHDNVRPHVSQRIINFLQKNNVRTLKHPPYSPDCNLCDRYLFPRLEALRCKKKFERREEIQQFLDQHMSDFSVQRIAKAISDMMRHFANIILNNGSYIV